MPVVDIGNNFTMYFVDCLEEELQWCWWLVMYHATEFELPLVNCPICMFCPPVRAVVIFPHPSLFMLLVNPFDTVYTVCLSYLFMLNQDN